MVASPLTVRITVTNLAPANGTLVTPVWFGFHDGGFDLYEPGAPASQAIEHLAEDANVGPLSTTFGASGRGVVQGVVYGSADIFNDLAPGNEASTQTVLDGNLPRNRYFSYAAMIVPSNDAFIANGNPSAYKVFDDDGNFVGADILVMGCDVLDAGTEINDEDPFHAAGTGPVLAGVGPLFIIGAGPTENGVVHSHPGYKPGGPVLSNPAFANADFTAQGYKIARITVEAA